VIEVLSPVTLLDDTGLFHAVLKYLRVMVVAETKQTGMGFVPLQPSFLQAIVLYPADKNRAYVISAFVETARGPHRLCALGHILNVL
jgi:hypothetical protein